MKRISVVWGLLIVCVFTLTACVHTEDELAVNNREGDTVVYFEGIPYSGKYEGEVSKNNTPNGVGRLQAVNYKGEELVFVGNWVNGELEADSEITLPDQSVIYVKYEKNLAQDYAKRVWTDNSYAIYEYQDGFPVGNIIYFNKNEEITEIDRFYDNCLISEWCEIAETVEYSKLFTQPENYFRDPIKFSGVVTDILDDDQSTKIIVKNDDGQTMVGTYKNGRAAAKQALVENLRIGESVTIYGFYLRNEILDLASLYSSSHMYQLENVTFDLRELISEHSDDNYTEINDYAVYSTLPVIEMFSAETEYKELDLNQLEYEGNTEYEYELLSRYPYYLSDFKIKDRAEVVRLTVNADKKRVDMLLQIGDNQLLYGQYKYNKKLAIPAVGDKISFTAVMRGNYKLERMEQQGEKTVVSYLLIPNLSIKSIE